MALLSSIGAPASYRARPHRCADKTRGRRCALNFVTAPYWMQSASDVNLESLMVIQVHGRVWPRHVSGCLPVTSERSRPAAPMEQLGGHHDDIVGTKLLPLLDPKSVAKFAAVCCVQHEDVAAQC